MARLIRSIGFTALNQSLETLARTGARPFIVVPRTLRLEPGATWEPDSVLLSATPKLVEYARGDTLFEEETFEFLANSYSTGSKLPAWMSGLSPAHCEFAFRVAQALAPWWAPHGSVAAWLARFGAYYRSHRTDIELAGRYAGSVLEGLFGLRSRWTSLFQPLVASMGEGAAEVFGKWVGPSDGARLVGILIGSEGDRRIAVEELAEAIRALREAPTEEFERCLAAPVYPTLVVRAEQAAGRLAPVIAKLRAGL